MWQGTHACMATFLMSQALSPFSKPLHPIRLAWDKAGNPVINPLAHSQSLPAPLGYNSPLLGLAPSKPFCSLLLSSAHAPRAAAALPALTISPAQNDQCYQDAICLMMCISCC